jgi:translation initiation factor IF-2
MAKIRVHEIAKELGVPSKEMVDKLLDMGLDVKNHMSTLEESQANWVKKQIRAKSSIKEEKAGNDIRGNSGVKSPSTGVRDQQPQHASPQHASKGKDIRTERSESPAKKTSPGVRPKLQRQDNNQRQDRRSGRPNERAPIADQKGHTGQNKSYQGQSRDLERQKREPVKNQPQPNSGKKQNRSPVGEKRQNVTRPSDQPSQQRNGQSRSTEQRVVAPDRRSEISKNKIGEKGKNMQTPQAGKNKNRKNGPTWVKRDYSRPGRKPKHKRKKEEVVVQLPDKISIEDSITVRDLAEKLHLGSAELVKKLMELGTMASINQAIDFETAEIVASLYEVKVERAISEEEKILEEIVDDEASLKLRPPIVTVMGHVDHGKTSLLDRIRKADVVSGEAGGITQHIGAYQVTINDNRITFIDTPGHEAFTAMRARGANLTDIVVLVVAADDGVMPQTVEAINHIRAAGVPFVVAINKVDKPEANPERVMRQLTEHDILAEEWGGDIIFVPVSAKKGEGIDTLLEMILLVAEVHEIKANPDRPAEGVVIEGELDRGRGPVGTVLVLKGTLNVGDCLICGNNFCKVRAMTDHKGRRVEKAGPSMPVEITGWSEVPEAGGRVLACDEKVAKEVVNLRLSEKKIEEQKQSSRVSLDDFFKQMQESDIKELNMIIKGDVQGSIEALAQSLIRLATDEVKVNVIHSAVGAISETDVMLASASQAIIIGFNVRPDVKARKYAEDEGIDVRLYRVIYEAIEDVKKAMAGLLDPEYKEKYIGRAEVRATFKVPNVGMIAGSYVIDGKIQRNASVRVLRDGVIVYEGKLASLKRFKDDVREVVENYECGIGIQDFNDVKEGDTIEAYMLEEIPRVL